MDLLDYRSGAYEAQREYQSFIPSKIHRQWNVNDPAIVNLLGEADRSLGELNAYAQLIPDIDYFIRMYVAKEATQSSRIEGTQTNIEDAFKEAKDLEPEARDDWEEVQNYIQAINFAIEKLESLPLSNRLLRETHGVLLRGVRGTHKLPGEFRRSQNWIGVSLKNAVFIPPHHDHVEVLMSDMEKFLHDESILVPPLIKIAMAHYQFEKIHPFLDGNGRLGRLMISLYLASEGLLVKPALYLSDYFERNKTAYIDHLMAVREGHHMRDWLIFFLHGVKETAEASTHVFREILKLKEKIEREVLPHFSVRRQPNAQKVMQALYRNPIINTHRVRNITNTTTNTAAYLLEDLVKHGVLIQTSQRRRDRFYVFIDYIDLFS